MGVQIPNDISLISFDEQIYSDLLFAPLSTVSHLNEDIGNLSLKMLFDQFENSGKKKPQNTILKSKLIIRNSVKDINGN